MHDDGDQYDIDVMSFPARATTSYELRLLAAGRGFNFQVVAGRFFFRSAGSVASSLRNAVRGMAWLTCSTELPRST